MVSRYLWWSLEHCQEVDSKLSSSIQSNLSIPFSYFFFFKHATNCAICMASDVRQTERKTLSGKRRGCGVAFPLSGLMSLCLLLLFCGCWFVFTSPICLHLLLFFAWVCVEKNISRESIVSDLNQFRFQTSESNSHIL